MEVPGVISTGSRLIVLEERIMTLPSEEYRTIPLTRGQVAIVDAADYEWLMQHNWHAKWSPCNRAFYAYRNVWVSETGTAFMSSMHREILGIPRGDKRQGDHINRNTLDNRRSNLRIVTGSENRMNQCKKSNNTSGRKGVSYSKEYGKWDPYITVNGKLKHLGYRETFEEACTVRAEAEKLYHGEFARSE